MNSTAILSPHLLSVEISEVSTLWFEEAVQFLHEVLAPDWVTVGYVELVHLQKRNPFKFYLMYQRSK